MKSNPRCVNCLVRIPVRQGWKLRGYRGAICAACLRTRVAIKEVFHLLNQTRQNANRQSRRIRELTEQRNFYRQLSKNKVCRCKKRKPRASKEEIERELEDLDARILRGEV